MSKAPVIDSAASRHAGSARERLKAAGKAADVETRFLETRFVLERFLHRMTRSSWAERATLKGGLMMVDLLGDHLRPTEDLDAHMDMTLTPDQVRGFVRDVCAVAPESEDGLEFVADQVKIERIMEGHVPGVRASFKVRWANATSSQDEIALKIDLAWGDAPLDPIFRELPAVLPKHYPAIRLASYPWEQVLAEKIHALARHGYGTTRMKDFFDIVMISRHAALDAGSAAEALRRTFRSWKKPELTGDMEVFDDGFPSMVENHWKRFRQSKNGVKGAPSSMADAMVEIVLLVRPLVELVTNGGDPSGGWDPESGWEFARTPSLISMS